MAVWLLLVHRLGGESSSLRVRLWRRLRGLGAVPMASGVHALPASAAARARLESLARELTDAGAETWVVSAKLDGADEARLRDTFRDQRRCEYTTITTRLPTLRPGARPTPERRAEIASALGRARTRLAELAALDPFRTPERARTAAAIAALEHRLLPTPPSARMRALPRSELVGRVWVTRRDVHVDRLACAWLVRRFLDPGARFRFVAGIGPRPKKSELSFDMAGAHFTHEGERCSFETLLTRTGLASAALQAVAEVVHDLDLEDGRYGRVETRTTARRIDAIVAAHDDDSARIDAAMPIFDELCSAFGDGPARARSALPSAGRKRLESR